MTKYYSLDGMTDDMFDPDTLKGVAIAGGVGLVTAMLGGRALSYVEEMLPIDDPATKEYVASAIGVGLGLLAGAYIHQFSPAAAYAVAGVMIGEGAARIVRKAANMDPQWQLNGGAGGSQALREVSVELMRQLRAPGNDPRLAATVVTQATRSNGLEAVPSRYKPYMS